MPTPSGATKAEKFAHHQLRSLLDEGKASEDDPWEKMLLSGLCQLHAEVNIDLALPSSAEAEACLLSGVEQLSEAFDKSNLRSFYKSFGWSDAKEYFSSMGETQVMLVDIDHNDSDDRLAIILLAFQAASANLERLEKGETEAKATILLDGRTYETAGGLTLWRSLQLASRLTAALAPGVEVLPVISDSLSALKLMCSYLKVDASFEALNRTTTGTGDFFRSLKVEDLRAVKGAASVWMLSGLCTKQVEDFAFCQKNFGTRFTFIEQAQPAWQSVDFPASAEVQPSWAFPPAFGEEKGFGVEPSNIRSSEATYTETLTNYLRFQQLVAPGAKYVCPALARSNGFLPAPAREPMLTISGRPFNVIPGKEYVIKKALDVKRAQLAFGNLLQNAKACYEDSLYPELCIDSCDDFGADRPELAAVVKYGTFMADAIVVCLAARPRLQTLPKRRRLALALVPRPGEDPVMTFQL